MQVVSSIRTLPLPGSRWIAPVGQPIRQTASTQCMQALATMMFSCSGPWRTKRGLLSWAAAQARTQSSQAVQRSVLIAMTAVPFMVRVLTRKSISVGSTVASRRSAKAERCRVGSSRVAAARASSGRPGRTKRSTRTVGTRSRST